MAGDDFVMVQLTKAGEAFAKGSPMRLSNGRRTFLFEQGKPLRVEKSYEWFAVLSRHVTPNGVKLFELVPPTSAAPAPAAPAPTPAASAAPITPTVPQEKK